MNGIESTTVPRLLPGVRLRALDDGALLLLVPEGAVKLTTTGAAVIESIDGRRDVAGIVALMGQRFEASEAEIAADVAELLGQFAERLWIEFAR